MKGYNINLIVAILVMMLVSIIIFGIMSMFFNATPSVGYDRQVVPIIDHTHREFCAFEEKTRWIDSCILDNTVILREEGYYESYQRTEHICVYKLKYKTGVNMTINCSETGKLCYLDKTGKYDMGKCK